MPIRRKPLFPFEFSLIELNQTRNNELLFDKTFKLVEERMAVEAITCVSESGIKSGYSWQSCKTWCRGDSGFWWVLKTLWSRCPGLWQQLEFCIYFFPWVCLGVSCPSLHLYYGVCDAASQSPAQIFLILLKVRSMSTQVAHSFSLHRSQRLSIDLTKTVFQEVRVTGTMHRWKMHKVGLWQPVRKQVCIMVD